MTTKHHDILRFLQFRYCAFTALNISLLCFLFVLPGLTLAQEDDEDADEELVFELSPFTVDTSRDRGYLSTNSVSGTSLNMRIRDLPMPLEVINQEFIEDLQATDMKEALEYSSGVFQRDFTASSSTMISILGKGDAATPTDISPSNIANVNNPFTNSVIIRGYAVPNQQRLGFRVGAGARGSGWSIVTGGFTDTSNAERLEVVRGPASLLYGINVLSGVVNMIPKRPLSEPRAYMNFTTGSDHLYRGSLDVTGPVIRNKLNYRLIATYQESGHYTMFRETKSEYYVGQLEWMVDKRTKTRLFVEGQYGDFQQNGIGSQFFVDNPAGGRAGSFEFRNEFFEPFTWGVDYTEAIAKTPGRQLSNYFTQDVLDNWSGQALPLPESIDADGNRIPDSPFARQGPYDYWSETKDNLKNKYGSSHRISGPHTYYNRLEKDFLALLTSEPLKNLSIELGAYYTDVDEMTFSNSLRTDSNTVSTISPAMEDETREIPRRDPIFIRQLPFWRNPEVVTDDDPIGWGVLERFAIQTNFTRQGDEYLEVPKWNSYWWSQNPKGVESLQLRGRAAYTIDTSWFDGAVEATHSFIAGYQFIRDDFDIVKTPNPGNNNLARLYTPDRLDDDPLVFRSSVFDMTPIRYNGEEIIFPGIPRGFSATDVGETTVGRLDHITRSEHMKIRSWNRGSFLIYQGSFMDDRLTVVGGIRHDAYQVRETERIRLMDEVVNLSWVQAPDPYATRTGEHTGTLGVNTSYIPLPYLVGSANKPLTFDELPASIQNATNIPLRSVDYTLNNGEHVSGDIYLADAILNEHSLLRGEVSEDLLRSFGTQTQGGFSETQIQEWLYWDNTIDEQTFKSYLSDNVIDQEAIRMEVEANIENPTEADYQAAFSAAAETEFQDIAAEAAMREMGIGPKGTTEHAFEKTQTFVNPTLGFSYRITDPLSIYFMHSQGVFPNQGLRDGLDNAIDAEQTISNEIGLKFDFFDGMISGTVSVYRIERENAIFRYTLAPNPARWHGGINGEATDVPLPLGFEGRWALGDEDASWVRKWAPITGLADPSGDGRQIPNYSYYLNGHYVALAWAHFHPEDVVTEDGFKLPKMGGASNINSPNADESLKKLYELYDLLPIYSASENALNPYDPKNLLSAVNLYYSVDLVDITDEGSIGNIRPEDLPREEMLSFAGIENMEKLLPSDMVDRINENGGQVPEEYLQLASTLKETYGNPMIYALELAMRDRDYLARHFVHIGSTPQAFWRKFNASTQTSANVTYEEQANGFDGQIIFTPTDNYQALFSFSYTKREVTGGGFNLVELRDPLTNEIITDAVIDPDTQEIVRPSEIVEGKEYRPYGDWMRYESWVEGLGIWNFEDPSDPTSFNGGSVDGIDLAMIPEWNMSFWNKYTFKESLIEGLELAAGIRLQSSAPTAVAVGGSNFRENLFLPPDSKPHHEVDLSVSYSAEFWGARWRFALKVRNISDDWLEQNVVDYAYTDPLGQELTRTLRTVNVYSPRSWRFTVSAAF